MMIGFFRRGLLLTVLTALGAGSPQLRAQQADPGLEIYFSANGLYNRKLYDLAVADYKSFLAKFPRHEKALHAKLGLALSLFNLGRHAEAEPVLADLAASPKSPEPEQVHLVWGQSLLMINKPAKAEEAFSKALKLEKPALRESVLAGLVEALFQQQKWKEVIARGDELAKAKASYTPRAKFQGAVARYELRQYKEAAGLFGELATEAKALPFAQQTFFLLAECRRELGDLAGAEAQYDAARKLAGQFTGDALFRLGFVRFAQKKFAVAAADFAELRAKHKDHPSLKAAGLYLGRAQLENRDFKLAEATLAQVAAEPGAGADAALWQARAFSRQQKYAEAGDVLAKAAVRHAKDPLLADLLFDHGNALLGAGRFADAAKPLTRLNAEFPQFPQSADALRLRALCLHRAGQFAASADLCGEFLARHAGSAAVPEIAFLQAENIFFQEKFDAALVAYRKFIGAHAAHGQRDAAQLRVGQTLHQQQKWADAVKEFESLAKLKKADPLFAQVDFLLGDCLFQQEKWDAAIAALSRFLASQPKDPDADVALLKMALANDRKGDREKSTASLERMAREHPASVHLPQALVEMGRLRLDANDFPGARKAFTQVASSTFVPRAVPKTGPEQGSGARTLIGVGGSKVPATPAAAAQYYRGWAEYYLAWTALGEKNEEAAVKQFSIVADTFAGHAAAADARLQMAVLLARRNDEKSAAAAQVALSKFVQENPSDAKLDQAVFHLGTVFAKQRQWGPALEQFHKVAAMDKSALRDRAFYEAAWVEKGAGRVPAAFKEYESLLARFPQSPLAGPAAFELAELEYEAKNVDGTLKRLNKLLAETKDSGLRSRAQYRLAWCQFDKGDFAAAAKSYETVLKDAPPELIAVAAYQAGESQLKLKAYKAALAHFQKSSSAAGGAEIKEQALLRTGECQASLGQWADAEKSYALFTEKFPKHELCRRARLGLGWSLENQQKFSEALPLYETVLTGGERDDLAARAQFQTGECLFAQKKNDDAIRAFIKVEVGYGYPEWSARALLRIGNVLERKGDRPGALERFREVAQRYPDTDAAQIAKDRLR
jgi:TolA-binding protein